METTGETQEASVPQAWSGARDGNLLPSVSLAQNDAALAPPECRAMTVIQTQACHVTGAGLVWPVSSARLPDVFLTLPAAPVRIEAAPLPADGVLALRTRQMEGWRIEAPKSGALRMPRLTGPRVRWGADAVLSRIALTRRGREAPPNIPFPLAFRAEALRLAQAANLPPDDVTLLGIYPGVPLLAVSRVVVADEGRQLRLWLKPEVLRGRQGGRLITLLVGRQNSSGKMLQAAL